jgi:hypothetical protein
MPGRAKSVRRTGLAALLAVGLSAAVVPAVAEKGGGKATGRTTNPTESMAGPTRPATARIALAKWGG